MTTEYTKQRSPRLPENHPLHVERILAKSKPRGAFLARLGDVLYWALVVAIILGSIAGIYELSQ